VLYFASTAVLYNKITIRDQINYAEAILSRFGIVPCLLLKPHDLMCTCMHVHSSTKGKTSKLKQLALLRRRNNWYLGHSGCDYAWYGFSCVADSQADDLRVWVLLLVCFTSHANLNRPKDEQLNSLLVISEWIKRSNNCQWSPKSSCTRTSGNKYPFRSFSMFGLRRTLVREAEIAAVID
jgi:hypothetical protein